MKKRFWTKGLGPQNRPIRGVQTRRISRVGTSAAVELANACLPAQNFRTLRKSYQKRKILCEPLRTQIFHSDQVLTIYLNPGAAGCTLKSTNRLNSLITNLSREKLFSSNGRIFIIFSPLSNCVLIFSKF